MLQTKTIKLRRIESEYDIEFITFARNNEEIYKHFYEYFPVSKESQKHWLKEHEDKQDEKFFGIFYEEGPHNILIGTVSVYHIDWRNRKAEWGRFFIDKRGRDIPYAGKIVEALILDYVFNHLNLNRLYCEVLETNTKVIERHKSFGFKVEGLYKQYIYKEGKYINVIPLSLLYEDFKSNTIQDIIKNYLNR